jgi:hypothetical protein
MGQLTVDLTDAVRFPIRKPKFVFYSVDVFVYYYLPSKNVWIRHIKDLDVLNNINENSYYYELVDPVEAAHDLFMEYRGKLPLELEPYREWADPEGFRRWLADRVGARAAAACLGTSERTNGGLDAINREMADATSQDRGTDTLVASSAESISAKAAGGRSVDTKGFRRRLPRRVRPPSAVGVELVDGRHRFIDLAGSTRWTGRTETDPFAPLIGWLDERQRNIYRTACGRWLLCKRWHIAPADREARDEKEGSWQEITPGAVCDWFAEQWVGPGVAPTESVPADIAAWLAARYIAREDRALPAEAPPQGAQAPQSLPPAVGALSEKACKRGGEKAGSDKRWEVIRIYHDRLRKNENVSNRAIASVAECSAGYVSKVLKGLRPNRRDAAPRGFKSRDGSLEASA